MSLLVVGISHRTAPLAVLEAVALDTAAADALAADLRTGQHVVEAVVLATCNRLEVYADVTRFHGGVADIGAAVAGVAGLDVHALSEHLYVHFEDRAVAHLFAVACGLDSMAVGEAQILGQVRGVLRRAEDAGAAGRVLGPLLRHALHAGKRAHAETALDSAGRTLLNAGLARAYPGPLGGARTLVVGAGSMSSLVASTLARRGAHVVVANRGFERGARLAASVGGVAVPLEALEDEMVMADVVVLCTGAVGHMVDVSLARSVASRRARRGADADLPVVDLALPRDVAPEAAAVPGLRVVDLEDLGRELAGTGVDEAVGAVRTIVEHEVGAALAAARAEQVAPTVVALREHAGGVVATELERLRSRLAAAGAVMDERTSAELEQTVHRVVEKLLHTPTVRVKQRGAVLGDSGALADALRELFDLDLAATTITSVGDLPRDTRVWR